MAVVVEKLMQWQRENSGRGREKTSVIVIGKYAVVGNSVGSDFVEHELGNSSCGKMTLGSSDLNTGSSRERP